MKKNLLSSLVIAVLLSGCGGGGGGDSSSASGDGGSSTPTDTRSLIASFTGSKTYLSEPYDFINGMALFDVDGIHSSLFTFNVNIYDDGSVETFDTRYNIYDKGILNRLFATFNPINSAIDASCINSFTCYDKNSKIYYEVESAYNVYEKATKLVSIINDGLTAVVQLPDNTTRNTAIKRVYSELNMPEVGIKIKPAPVLHQGVATELVESGFANSEYGKPYTFDGMYYLYKIEGVSFSAGEYAIYNNGNVSIRNSNSSTTQNGYVSQYYKRIKPVDKTNTNYEYVSSYTYYDSVNKVFYETKNPYGQDTITAITNDGNTAVFSNGRNFQITKAYQKVE